MENKSNVTMFGVVEYLKHCWEEKNEPVATHFFMRDRAEYVKFSEECYKMYGYMIQPIFNPDREEFKYYNLTVRYLDDSQVSAIKFWQADNNGHREVIALPKKHLFGYEQENYPGLWIGIELNSDMSDLHGRKMILKNSRTERMMAGRDHVFYQNYQDKDIVSQTLMDENGNAVRDLRIGKLNLGDYGT
jgi:hypothetical protein